MAVLQKTTIRGPSRGTLRCTINIDLDTQSRRRRPAHFNSPSSHRTSISKPSFSRPYQTHLLKPLIKKTKLGFERDRVIVENKPISPFPQLPTEGRKSF